MSASLAILVASVLLAAATRRYNLSSPLFLVLAGLVVGLIFGEEAVLNRE